MSADRELLELAAKAYGNLMVSYQGGPNGGWVRLIGHNHDLGCDVMVQWNPLTDDGDALRLAADLRLEIKPGKHKGDGCTVETQRPGIAGCTAFYDDKAQQMRQAIVRAAAEIGKAMP